MLERHQPMSWWAACLLALLSASLGIGLMYGSAAVRALASGWGFPEALESVSRDPFNLALVQAASVGAVLALGLRIFAPDIPIATSMALRPLRARALGLALVAGMALQFPLSELGNLLQEVFPQSLEQQIARQRFLTPDDLPTALATILAVVIVAPVSEELLFRGLVQRGLCDRYGARLAVCLAAVLFGLSHFEPGAIVYATVAGLLFGVVAHRWQSTLLVVVMHAGVNLVPLLLPSRVISIRGFNTVGEHVYHLPLPLTLGSGVVALAAYAVLLHGAADEAE